MTHPTIGFFTRLLDRVPDADRYRHALDQIRHAEAYGFSSAWVAQHHFDGNEGGLPSPLVFLTAAAAQTSSIRLGTGIITLPLESPVRVAEDASVLDVLSDGRLDIGVGSGGTPSSFAPFGAVSEERATAYAHNLQVLRTAWSGGALSDDGRVLFPPARGLADRIWQATFSVSGGQRAGAAGDGLMLSRTQPRTEDAPTATLAEIQLPIVAAYLDALPAGTRPRIMASRSVFVADTRAEADHFAQVAFERHLADRARTGRPALGGTVAEFLAGFDAHCGTADDVIASLGADRTLDHADQVTFQVHSIDPPHPHILRSIELVATDVAPALGRNLSENATAQKESTRVTSA